jgi:hypothetical protein
MSDGGPTIFGYGYNGGGPADTLTNAAAESIVVAGGEVVATDIITNWDASDSLLIAGAVGGFSGDAGTFATLKEAFAVAGAANSVALAGIGSAATGYTAYALIYDGTAAAGAIQLGGDNVFTATNYVNELTAAQVI